jgi:hypothetical protein
LALDKFRPRQNDIQTKFLFWGRYTLLRVADIGSSSHFRIYLVATLSKVSQIQILDISVIVKFHEIFESK